MWYWGWFERKEGSIPLGDGSIAGAIPIRRFRCVRCSRTFSWRPQFLVRWRRYAAATYEQVLKDWTLERGPRSRGLAWYQPGLAARKALCRKWRQRADEYFGRCGTPSELARRGLRHAVRHAAVACLDVHERPRFSSHYLLIAFARHPSGSPYSLAAS